MMPCESSVSHCSMLCSVSLVCFKSRKLLIKDVRKFKSLIIWQRGLGEGEQYAFITANEWSGLAELKDGSRSEFSKGKDKRNNCRIHCWPQMRHSRGAGEESHIIAAANLFFCIASAWVNNTNKDGNIWFIVNSSLWTIRASSFPIMILLLSLNYE